MKTEFLTPVGRLVQGDPFEAQTKNMQGQPLVTQSGQPTQRYFIAVAFAKMVHDPQTRQMVPNAEFAKLWGLLDQTGRSGFPALNILPPWDPACRFSWKVMDGDGTDDNGKPNANKEGFAGHWVVKFSSSFAPRCFHAGHYAPHEQIQDPKTIRRGYFVRVSGTAEGNGNAQKPGIYVNLSMVELAGQGQEITSGPDAASVFGSVPGALPAGATPLPMHAAAGGLPGMVAPGATLPGQLPPASLPGALPGMQPQQQMTHGLPGTNTGAGMVLPGAVYAGAALPPQQMAVQPHPGIMGNVGQPAYAAQGVLPNGGGLPAGSLPGLGGVASIAMMSPSEPLLTPKGQASGMSYTQMRALNYTDDVLRGNGYIL